VTIIELEAHRRTVTTPQGPVSCIDVGSGPVALFVHGVGTNALLWHHVIRAFAGERRCVAIDLPLHGRTPAAPGQDFHLGALAEVVEGFCEAAGLSSVDLVAHDTGGAVAQVFAARHSDRLRSLCLTNCDTHDNIPPEAFRPTVDLAASGALAEAHAEIGGGERVCIIGDSKLGLTILFRAVAGLWSRGSGRIGLPASGGVMFMPQRPYMRQGPLRDALSYPSAAHLFADADLVASCESVGLGHLASQLDRNANWDNELTSDEAQRLAFARLVLHKPRWVCVDQALDALSEADRRKTLAIFEAELATAAVISFGDTDICPGFSTRTLHLNDTAETRA